MIISAKKSIIPFIFLSLPLFSVSGFAQPVYADIAVSHTACVAPCASGVQNASFSSDGNLETYSTLNNSLGVGNTVEIVIGFSNTGDPGAMIVIPIKKSSSILDASLLSLITVEVMDASDNIIIQKEGLGTLDVGVLSAANETSAITLFAPPTGAFQVSKIKVSLAGALNVQASVFVGDPFYVEPTGSGCGIRYANNYNTGGAGGCLGCSIQNPEHATDADLTNYAQINMVVGIAASRFIELSFASPGNAGDFVGVIMGTGSGLLDINLLSNITITPYNGVTAGTPYTASSLLGASLLSGGSQHSMMGFNASSAFTSIRISMSAAAGLLNSMRIYGAVTYDPTPPVVSLSATPSDTVCDGVVAEISATGGFVSYAWSSGQSSQNISVTSSGSYAVVCTNGGGCPFFSARVRINVLTKPSVPTVTADPLSCLGGNVRFILGSSSAAYTYQVSQGGSALEGDIKTGTGSVMYLFSVPVFSSTTYRIQVTDTSNHCTALSVSDIIITAPSVPTQLSSELDYAKCWVKPGNRLVHFIQPGTTRILASINPQENDLGEVEVFSYVNASPINVQACGTYQPWYATTVLNRRWMIEPSQQPSSPVDVRLYFDNADFTALSTNANLNANPNDDIYTMSEMTLSRYDGLNEDGDFSNNCGNGNTEMYNVLGSGLASVPLISFDAGGRYADYVVPGFSEFWLHGNSNGNVSALPIVLSDFKVQCNEGDVEIAWATASEINNESFTVSRSRDAMVWEQLETISGAINSNVSLSYSFIDSRPFSGISYYRLHQTDLDGKQTYFEPLGVSCSENKKTEISVYPNPADDHFMLSVITNNVGIVVPLEIYDLTGNIVITNKLVFSENKNEYIFNVNDLKSGIYFIGIYLSEEKIVRKILIK